MKGQIHPQHIDERNWYYLVGKEVLFVHEVLDEAGNYLQTDQFRVPLSLIKKSLRSNA